MGRMAGTGISASCLPYSRKNLTAPGTSAKDVEDLIIKFAKQGYTESQIGVILRDTYGIAQVRFLSGQKIQRILKKNGLAAKIPEDLYHLIKKSLSIRKHLEKNKKDKDAKYRLTIKESRIHRITRYYRKAGKVPANFKYNYQTVGTIISQA